MPAPTDHVERARFYYRRTRNLTIVCVISSLTAIAFAVAAILD